MQCAAVTIQSGATRDPPQLKDLEDPLRRATCLKKKKLLGKDGANNIISSAKQMKCLMEEEEAQETLVLTTVEPVTTNLNLIYTNGIIEKLGQLLQCLSSTRVSEKSL